MSDGQGHPRAIAIEGERRPVLRLVRGDEAVPYGTVARVMAEIREAGFRRLSLVTQIEQGG